MKVLWVAHESNVAGAGLAMLESIRSLISVGFDVHVIFPSKGELLEIAKSEGISISIVPYTWWAATGEWCSITYKLKRFARNLFYVKKVTQIMKKETPDVVISNTLSILIGAIAAKLLGIPHIWYIHELYGEAGHNLYFDLGSKLSLFLMNKLSSKLIFNSQTTLNQFTQTINKNKLQILYYSVDIPSIENLSDKSETDVFEVVAVGRLDPKKRQEDIIKAVGHLFEKGYNIKLKIVGGGNQEYINYLQSLISKLQLSSKIEFLGYIPNPHRLVKTSDIAVISSQGEGFGRVTIEAMKLGKPVVGANDAGTTELVKDKWNGLLYKVADYRDLSFKLEILYNDCSLLKELGHNAQIWSTEKFNFQKHTADLVCILDSIMN